MLVNVIMINYIDYLLFKAQKKTHIFFSFDVSIKENTWLHQVT